MLRLFADQDFEPGQGVKLASEELHYFRRVRRAQGVVELFNRRGQRAKGSLKSGVFFVQEVIQDSDSALPLSLAVALPDSKVLRELIFSLSELGIRDLKVFAGERSQAPKSRISGLAKWDRWAIESARQCGRSRPLSVEVVSFESLLKQKAQEAFYLDEKRDTEAFLDLDFFQKSSGSAGSLVVVGCEGGWTDAERKALRSSQFRPIHLKAPVMRVHTACVVAASAFLCRASLAQ